MSPAAVSAVEGILAAFAQGWVVGLCLVALLAIVRVRG